MTDRGAGKVINPGWPDPNDWINTLYQRMADRQAAYDQETDPMLQRKKAAGMLAEVIQSLLQFPPFQKEPVHFPLKDLLLALGDLDKGRSPPWAIPVNVGGTSITNTADRELRSWVKAIFVVLEANHFKRTEAYKRIADGLNKSGRHGRKKTDPVRWRSVGEWCRSEDTPIDLLFRGRIEQWWDDFRSDTQHINLIDSWGDKVPDPSKVIAGKFADSCWELDHLRDRSKP
tara:strand:- start:2222 stop:2911 length:690 start_codon:yes stop_codon:yes gene_type:complete